jgi:Na+/melibiose symporter-like transporter
MSNNVGAGGTGYQDSRPDLNAYAGHFDDLDDKPVKREKRTVSLFGTLLDRDLLVCKLFYLFFFSAFGSLFPLISIYFKQLGMNATQAGLLVGLRPFVEFGSIPFWSSFADKFRQGKKLLLFCLLSWIVSTYLLNYMRPPTTYCLKCEMPDKDTDVCKMEPFKKQEMCEIVRG